MAKVLSQSQVAKIDAELEKLGQEIMLATPVTLGESEEEKEKRKKRLRNDPKAFQEYYIPTLKETPKYLTDAASSVLKNPKCFEWWRMFRGARKSTWTCVIIPLMLLARGELDLMLLIGPNQDFSLRLLGNLQTILEKSQRFISDYGHQRKYGAWSEGMFTTASGTTFVGLGIGQPVRGFNVNLSRPDYIVCSDIDKQNYNNNPDLCEKAYRWIFTDLMGTREAGGERFRFILDNNFAYKRGVCAKIQQKHSLTIHNVNVLDAKGKPAAPFINDEFLYGENGVFSLPYFAQQGEYFNNPIEEGNVFKDEWLKYKPTLSLKDYDYIISYCDPSFKNNKSSDYKAIVFVGAKNKEYHILSAYCRQAPIMDMVKWHWQQAKDLKDAGVYGYHYIEGGFIQDQFKKEYDDFSEKMGWYMDILIDTLPKNQKSARIESMQPMIANGRLFIADYLKGNSDMETGKEQLLAFEKGSRAHDDFPDCLQSCIAKLEERVQDIFTGRTGIQLPKVGKKTRKTKF